VLLAVTSGIFDEVELDEIAAAELAVRKAVMGKLTQLSMRIADGEALADEDREAMISISQAAVREMLQGGAGADA
jgi:F-type H+/Na+-transporting ATPase subunit alpha